jgi:hypothetical protein
MPRFYFHSTTRDVSVPDPRGIEFDSLARARAEVLKALREMVADALHRSEELPTFQIADEAGNVLMTVTPEDALRGPPDFPPRPLLNRKLN